MTNSHWTNDLLESTRLEGDPIADAAIAEAFELGKAPRVNELFSESDHAEG